MLITSILALDFGFPLLIFVFCSCLCRRRTLVMQEIIKWAWNFFQYNPLCVYFLRRGKKAETCKTSISRIIYVKLVSFSAKNLRSASLVLLSFSRVKKLPFPQSLENRVEVANWERVKKFPFSSSLAAVEWGLNCHSCDSFSRFLAVASFFILNCGFLPRCGVGEEQEERMTIKSHCEGNIAALKRNLIMLKHNQQPVMWKWSGKLRWKSACKRKA